jgi:starch-binding outer membrane protein, SusD/RagB family
MIKSNLKMKKHMKIKIFLAGILTLALVSQSCEDFLEENNKTGKTEDIIYTTETAVESLVASCYAYNRLWYGKEGGNGLSEGGTDLWWDAGDNKQRDLVTYRNLTPESSSDPSNNNHTLDQYWEAFYAAINVCNVAIKNLEEGDVLNADLAKQRLAEVKFLRAFYYWHMVETWGPVTLNLEPITAVNLRPTRNSVAEIYAQMFKDVNFAIKTLPASEAPSARVTHWAAKAFKARLFLYYASAYSVNKEAPYGHSEAPATYYDSAAILAREVIDGSGKELYDNYEDVWDITNEAIAANKEHIWGVEYFNTLGNTQSFNFLPPRLTTNENDDPEPWVSIISRRAPNDGNGHGNVMHLIYAPIWNNLSDNDGGPSITDVLVRRTGVGNYYTSESPAVQVPVDVGNFYVKYGMGYRRYAPTRYAMEGVWDETMDQRYSVTLRTAWLKHPDVVPQYHGTDSSAYPDMQDTAVWISNRPLTQAQLDWASTRYKVEDIDHMFNPDGSVTSVSTALKPSEFYPMMRKFENTDSPLEGNSPNFQDYFSYRDFPVFRISEMYLIAAEAYVMNNNAAAAVPLLNTLREKRAKDGMETAMQVTAAELDIDFILGERAREFAGENIRWFDLKRTMKLEEYISRNQNARDNFDPKIHYLRPIPATQMDAIVNETALPDPDGFWQNPGY